MQNLRTATRLARLVLAWFALVLGVAIASPVFKPQAVELICSGSAVKLLSSGEAGGKTGGPHALDCPLCVPVAAPPLQAAAATFLPAPDPAPQAVAAACGVAITSAPPPARGPPCRPLA